MKGFRSVLAEFAPGLGVIAVFVALILCFGPALVDAATTRTAATCRAPAEGQILVVFVTPRADGQLAVECGAVAGSTRGPRR